MSQPDQRLNAYRSDLAEVGLQDVVLADRYTAGEPGRIVLPIAPARLIPDRARPRDTEFLFGEPVTIFDRADGWAWIKSRRDGYVGYVDDDAVSQNVPEPTHRVNAIRSHLYPAPALKRFAQTALPFGSLVSVVDTTDRWAQIADGQWLYAAHLLPVEAAASDPVSVAMRFLEVPYLWGGRSSEGLDCSALIQFALEACGRPCPRDSDMQETVLGHSIQIDIASLQAGDLVFWPGHVGMMINETEILHANATDMATRVWTISTLRAHIIRQEGNDIRTIKRL